MRKDTATIFFDSFLRNFNSKKCINAFLLMYVCFELLRLDCIRMSNLFNCKKFEDKLLTKYQSDQINDRQYNGTYYIFFIFKVTYQSQLQ